MSRRFSLLLRFCFCFLFYFCLTPRLRFVSRGGGDGQIPALHGRLGSARPLRRLLRSACFRPDWFPVHRGERAGEPANERAGGHRRKQRAPRTVDRWQESTGARCRPNKTKAIELNQLQFKKQRQGKKKRTGRAECNKSKIRPRP